MPKLSILIPSITSRLERFLVPLLGKFETQIQSLENPEDVEVLTMIDNKRRSIGLKRDALVQSALGDYVIFCDDDDGIHDLYVKSLVSHIEENPDVDVVSITQLSKINDGNYFNVDFDINNLENEEASKDYFDQWIDIKRRPFHVCAFKRTIAQRHKFPDASYGEDWHWCERVLADVKTQSKIKTPIHFYHYRDDVTEAEHVFPSD